MCIVLFILPSRLCKTVLWLAPAPHVAPISPMDMDTAWDIAWATYGYLADLPLQRLSRTHRGWQMAKDGFWSPPPGDVSAGCRIDTPCTWTASGGGAARAPALRSHGNLLCSEIRVHLVDRWGRKKETWITGAARNITLGSILLLHTDNHILLLLKKNDCLTHQLHALLGYQKSLLHTIWGHCNSFQCYKSEWCWDTFH